MNEHDATELAFKNGYKQGTVDAVRKMQERLKKKAFQKTFICLNGESYVVYLSDIDQIAKEMLEGKDEE